ncbi:hypothetical protein C0J52_22958 [Blattella germanica]|nr:hypothetical protein C0J52_22958 [Blattella germanica]
MRCWKWNNFSDETTFYTNDRQNVWIWGTEHPHETVQHERDSPKVHVFCAVSNARVYGPFYSRTTLSQDAHDRALCAWHPRFPDITPCDFYLWGYIKDNVYVPPLPTTLDDFSERITLSGS